jgi:hypothetical protein
MFRRGILVPTDALRTDFGTEGIWPGGFAKA